MKKKASTSPKMLHFDDRVLISVKNRLELPFCSSLSSGEKTFPLFYFIERNIFTIGVNGFELGDPTKP